MVEGPKISCRSLITLTGGEPYVADGAGAGGDDAGGAVPVDCVSDKTETQAHRRAHKPQTTTSQTQVHACKHAQTCSEAVSGQR